jgi:hypothetical protein
MPRPGRALVLVALALGCASCGAPARPPAGTIEIKIGLIRQWPVRWVRVDQPLLIRVRGGLKPLMISPGAVVVPARWHAPSCAPDRCYALVAKQAGLAFIGAEANCGGFCVNFGGALYVEPTVCHARSVSFTPTRSPIAVTGSMQAVALSARGAGAEPTRYVLARYSVTRGPAFNYLPFLSATIDWGDGSTHDRASAGSPTGTITGTGTGPFYLEARHFYCQPCHYAATIHLTDEGGAGTGITNSATLTTLVDARP